MHYKYCIFIEITWLIWSILCKLIEGIDSWCALGEKKSKQSSLIWYNCRTENHMLLSKKKKNSTIVWNEQWTHDPQPLLSLSPGTSDPSKCYFPLSRLHSKCLTSTSLLPSALISVFPALLLIVLQDLPHSNPSELVSPITEILSTNEKIKQVRRYMPLYMYCLQPKLSKHFYVLGHLSLLFP